MGIVVWKAFLRTRELRARALWGGRMKAGGAGRRGERSRVPRQHGSVEEAATPSAGVGAWGGVGSGGPDVQRARAAQPRHQGTGSVSYACNSFIRCVRVRFAPDSAGMRGPRPLSAWHTVQQTNLSHSGSAGRLPNHDEGIGSPARVLVRCTWKMYCEGASACDGTRVRARRGVSLSPWPCAPVRSSAAPFTVRAYLTSGSDTREFNGFISLPIISLVFSTCLVLHIFEFDVPRALRECGLAD